MNIVQIRSSDAFAKLTAQQQANVVEVYRQARALDGDDMTLSDEDLTRIENAAARVDPEAVRFLRQALVAGKGLNAAGMASRQQDIDGITGERFAQLPAADAEKLVKRVAASGSSQAFVTNVLLPALQSLDADPDLAPAERDARRDRYTSYVLNFPPLLVASLYGGPYGAAIREELFKCGPTRISNVVDHIAQARPVAVQGFFDGRLSARDRAVLIRSELKGESDTGSAMMIQRLLTDTQPGFHNSWAHDPQMTLRVLREMPDEWNRIEIFCDTNTLSASVPLLALRNAVREVMHKVPDLSSNERGQLNDVFL